MKTLLLILLFPLTFFAQEKLKTINIYTHTNGIKSLHPTGIIEVYENRTEHYDVNFGIKEITPSEIIIDNKVYYIDSGIQDLLPSKEIEIIENPEP